MPAQAVIGCVGLGRVELVVTELERSRHFYRDVVGLTPAPDATDGACVFIVGNQADVLVLREGPVAGCSLAAWRVTSATHLDTLAHRLAEVGVSCTRTAWHGSGAELRFVEPATGATQAFWLPEVAPDMPAFAATHTRIQRLGHVVFATPRADAAVLHAQQWLDFRLSDWIEGSTSFLRPAGSPYHHGLGIGRSHTPGFHHLNFMVSEIDDIGRALHRMSRLDIPVVFGPGRHPISGSVFLYFLDPDGLTLEYSFGMETFTSEGARPPRHWSPAPESVDLWGSQRLAAMGRLGALLPAHEAESSCTVAAPPWHGT